ncbi:hypothetical protein [Mesorhizobium sp. ANAO-SY3R2]|uniref:hypothetical protein n=1 Tax=Mesorhizobium sp. ANAO-SY3R2 TaxID=3166644 RepID=UPI00366B8430
MRRTYSQIDLDERRKIERWRQAGANLAMSNDGFALQAAIHMVHAAAKKATAALRFFARRQSIQLPPLTRSVWPVT